MSDRRVEGLRHDLPSGRAVFVSVDVLENPRANDGQGYAVSFEVDGKSVSDLNLSGETIEALYKTYRRCRALRRKKSLAWTFIAKVAEMLERTGAPK